MSEPGLFGELRWTPTELGAALALTTQRLSQLTKEGILPAPVEGRFHPQDTVRAYVQHLRKREAGRSHAGEAVRKMQLENEMRSIKLRKIAGSLVPVDRVQKDWYETGRRIRDALLNLPSRLSGPFAAESHQERIFDLFSKEIHAVLTELSSRQFGQIVTESLPLEESTQPEQAPDRGEAAAHDVPDDGGLERLLDDSQPPGEVHGPAESNASKFDEAFLDQGTDEDSEHRLADGD